jgi:hypothetical protein
MLSLSFSFSMSHFFFFFFFSFHSVLLTLLTTRGEQTCPRGGRVQECL